MDTSAISYRVADFLKKHPPFHAMDDGDLLALAARGRVRFHEANEFILWQGEPHKLHVFVIQQGTVSLWDEADGHAALRDVRGAGDMLGHRALQRRRAPCCLHSARSASDVVIYAFPADGLRGAGPEVSVRAPVRGGVRHGDGRLSVGEGRARPADDVPARRGRPEAARDAAAPRHERSARLAQSMLTTGSDAIAVVDGDASRPGRRHDRRRPRLGRRGRRQRRPADRRLCCGDRPRRSARPRRSPTACWRWPRPAPTRWP